MKDIKILIIAVLSVLTVVFSVLTVITFFSSDYVRAKDKVEYCKSETYKNFTDPVEAEEELEEAKEDLAPIETRGIVFAIIAGCSLLILTVYLVVSKIQKSYTKKLMNN